MSYPNIKSRKENLFNHWITPFENRRNFLRRNPRESMWRTKKPAVNVLADNELYRMEVALPGFNKSEILITLNGGILTVKGEKSHKESPVSKFIQQEFDVDIVERKFKLSEEIDHEKIEARYENGILHLTFIDVPTSEESYVKKIAIQ